MPRYTVQIPEEYRDLFPGLSPHDRAHSQITILSDTEGGVAYQIARDVDGLEWGDVSEFPIKETGIPIGQELTQALSGRVASGGAKFDPVTGKPSSPWEQFWSGEVGRDDPIFANVFTEGDAAFDASTLFNQAMGPFPDQPSVPAGPPLSSEKLISSEMMRAQTRKWLDELDLEETKLSKLQAQIESQAGINVTNKNVGTGVMTANEMGASQTRGELTTWKKVANEYKGKELIKDPMQGDLEVINPAFLQAVIFASQQNGFISDQQVAIIKAEADKAMVTDRITSDMALAIQQGSDETAIAEIRRDGDVDIANAQASIEQARFVTQQSLETLRVNAQLMQGTEQHDQIMKQLGLQESQRSNEYKIQNAQIEAAAAEDLRRYDLNEAESSRRFDLQMKELMDRRAEGSLQFTVEMEQLANVRAESAEQAASLQAAMELEAEQTQLRHEQLLDQQQKDLEQQQLNFIIQTERDKVTAQTNLDIAAIQREQAGNTDETNRQIAERQSEEAEQLALLDQLTTLGVGAQQLEATLAGTAAEVEIAATQAAAQKEAQLAIRELQDSAAINELEKASAIATLQAEAQQAGQLAQQQLRETTILGELDKAQAIATLQQEMQITAQAATAALQVNQGMSELDKAEAIATIQENTRQSTNIALAEIQANTRITELEKTNIIAGLQAGATTAAATTQAGAITGAAALQAEAAGPFGYVGAGADPVDRAQRLTDAQSILGAQYNPQAGATPFGALATAPDARYQDILDLQQAQAAQGPFQAAELGQQMADIGTIQRGGLTPEQQLALAQAPGNPFGFTANEAMALQNSLARGGLTPTQRLAEVQAGAAPQNMANYLNFIGNPAAVGFAGQTGFLQNMADSPEGNLPASLFGLNVPQNAPTVPTNPTMADLTDLTDEQLGFYQGQQAAQNYQTPSQIFQQAQMVTPQGV